VSFQEFHLDTSILSGIKAAGYTTPTPIQQQAIPSIVEGKDLLGIAQTGTGKTAAFALPIINHLIRQAGPRKVRALVVAPTRELAEQIHQACTGFAQNTKVNSIAIYGGVSKIPQLKALRRCPEIMVACPGRLLDLVNDRAIDLSGIEVLVLDEADTMCDMGFLPDVRRILKLVPSKRQTLLFSATMPEDIRKLAVTILKDPTTVQVDPIAPAKTVSHALYPVPDSLKRGLLLALLEQTPAGRMLVFTRTKHRTKRLALDLANQKYRVASLQGNLSQNRRQQSMDGFRLGKFDILVATDIAAHGIDVPEVSP
jgi:ATP-dependent RNA helicase RhlE